MFHVEQSKGALKMITLVTEQIGFFGLFLVIMVVATALYFALMFSK